MTEHATVGPTGDAGRLAVETKDLRRDVQALEAKVDRAITECRRCERLLAVSSGAHPRYPEVLAVQEAHDRLVILVSTLMG